MLGFMNDNLISAFIGFGILMYGLTYVVVHEILIHQRIKRLTRTNHPYFKAIRYAHKIHHKNIHKEEDIQTQPAGKKRKLLSTV